MNLRQDVSGALLLGASPFVMEMLYRIVGIFTGYLGKVGDAYDGDWNRWLVGPTVFSFLILGAAAGFAAPKPIA